MTGYLIVDRPPQTAEPLFIIIFISKLDLAPLDLLFPFGFQQYAFGHSSPQHWSLHTALSNTLRVPELRLTFLEASRPLHVLHLRQKARVPIPQTGSVQILRLELKIVWLQNKISLRIFSSGAVISAVIFSSTQVTASFI